MSNTKNIEGYNGIYLERSGKDSLAMVETLMNPPEFPLVESEKDEIQSFETFIFNHDVLDGITVGELPSIIKSETTTAPQFFAEAFLKGKITLPELDGVNPTFDSSADVYKWLASQVHNSTVDEETMRKMAKESSKYYVRLASEKLLDGGQPDSSTLDYMSIVLNPDEIIRGSESAVQARQFLKSLRHDYKEGGNRLDGAKRALIDVYLAKINRQVVGNMTTLDYLVDQSKLIGDEDTASVAAGVIPPAIFNALEKRDSSALKVLDYLRNGKGFDEDGNATAVDEEVIGYDAPDSPESVARQPLFTIEQREKLKDFKLKPQEMIGLYSRILRSGGLLSSEDSSTWSPTRTTRAADGKWQVVINPGRGIFEVDGYNGSFKVPSEERSIFDCIITGGFHELEHVNQNEINHSLSKNLKIIGLKGKRAGMLFEGGANFKQRQAEAALFGKSKPISLAYARALQVIENGGSIFDAARASYKEKLRTLPDSDPAELATVAARSVLRLKAHGGMDSQPMAYAEEVIMGQELKNSPVEVKARAVAVTSLDFVDQVRLYRYGLLELPESAGQDWTEFIMKEAEPYIKAALSVA
ncbi:MAG: hypothetical protein NTV39_00890 [Candidatus Saccharibacteria bacterium]|nr:hypothetical protein [Candidatus Saccharibacteria bacterium]